MTPATGLTRVYAVIILDTDDSDRKQPFIINGFTEFGQKRVYYVLCLGFYGKLTPKQQVVLVMSISRLI